ncbi:hypothetical protein [Acinetobacter radioresistens]|uniref:hypothetical protein n=1 Tax=Acinetobacter radioresistens TaxID=40216 RepID=UPI002245817B|nr:hypothetical protein [Acinetobacter radioresistens]MCX0334783.1 hypothetical protein [Acinetobacter radioresistens]MCX0338290.1 hypothetical protein [Acinetobacter radioresistens]
MSYTEIQQRLEEERKILAMHQQNLDAFIDQGYKNFVSEDTLRQMLLKNESVVEKYNSEFNRLISEINLSGRKIADLTLELKNFVIRNA